MLPSCARLVIAGSALASAFAGDPPRPSLEEPVDYIGWVNEEFGRGIRDNAADLYRQAAEKFVMHQVTEDAIKDKQRSEWTEDDRKAIRAWAEANADAISLFEQAAKKRDCLFELGNSEDGSLLMVLLPEYAKLRSIGKLLRWRSLVELSENRSASAVGDALALIRAGTHFQSQPTLIAYLVGISFRALAYDLLASIPTLVQDAPDYAAALTQLRANDPVVRGPDRQFIVEWATYLDGVQRFLKDSDGDGRFDRAAGGLAAVVPDVEKLPPLRPMTFEEALAEGDACYAEIRKYVSMPVKSVEEHDQRMLDALKARGPSLAAIMVPSLARSVVLYQRCVVTRSAVRIIFNAHAFKAKNGRWPRDLTEATADESPGIRKDPFSGKELVYRLEGDSFLLYSVGEDFNDDGGKRGAKDWTRDEPCDAILWPMRD